MTSASSHSLKEQDFHIPIAFAFDKNYLIPAGACLYSLLESIAKANKKIRYTLHALVVGLNEEDKAKLNQITEPFKEFAALEVKDIEPFLDTIPNPFDEDFTKRFSKMVLVKYFLADLFPKYSKMVWSDVDVIFCNEFSTDFLSIKEDDENYFYGVLGGGERHVLEGFLFCNLDYQRKNHFVSKTHALLEENKATEELDFTQWCWPNMKALGIEYCVFPYYYTVKDFSASLPENYFLHEIYKKTISNALKNPIIIHYDVWWGAVKPWDYPFGLKADLWLNALAKTPFMSDYTKRMHTNESFYTTKMAEQHYFSSIKSSKEILFKTPYLFFKSYLFVVFKERKIHLRIFALIGGLVKKFFNKLIYFGFLMPKALAKRVVSKILRVLGLHGIVKKILIQLKLLRKG
ncbi:glycosyltransferase family 8 protein [Helicobacter pylori]|uniref:glycosyltransferase family 8 protein n=1 Tax=Helicobacter pylori TaxID=210 RepID=UPI00165CE3CA|nr:glycosyltransferase family 8 protein [Helicobacter pylori]